MELEIVLCKEEGIYEFCAETPPSSLGPKSSDMDLKTVAGSDGFVTTRFYQYWMDPMLTVGMLLSLLVCSKACKAIKYQTSVLCWRKLNGKLACTQMKCQWILLPFVKDVEYTRVRDINFKSAKKLKSELDDSINNFSNGYEDDLNIKWPTFLTLWFPLEVHQYGDC